MLRLGRLDDADDSAVPPVLKHRRWSRMPAYIAACLLLVLVCDLMVLMLRA